MNYLKESLIPLKMKNNFKVVDFKADRLVIVKNDVGRKNQQHSTRRVVVRLFDEATVNRLIEAGGQQTVTKPSRLGRWWK